jgi:hypothetical protein
MGYAIGWGRRFLKTGPRGLQAIYKFWVECFQLAVSRGRSVQLRPIHSVEVTEKNDVAAHFAAG